MTFVGFFLCFFISLSYSYGTSIHDSPIGIYGGHSIPIKDAPYIASLRIHNTTSNITEHVCGASIIHTKYLLTAAHCLLLTNTKNPKYMVLVGTDKINTGGTLYDVKKIVPHKKFRDYEFDIALIKLSKDIKFGPNVAKLSLPYKKPRMHEGLALNATGWGKTEISSKLSESLRQVKVQVVARKKCSKEFEREEDIKITKKMICAGGNGEDTCQGDSGGPLTMGNILVGITSFGIGCGMTPGIYTQVSKMLPWIIDRIGIMPAVEELSKNLLQVELPVVGSKECAKDLERYIVITDKVICAGGTGKDTCQGDSGGLLTLNNTLVSITSFGISCGESTPGIYTSVSYMLPWIEEKMKEFA